MSREFDNLGKALQDYLKTPKFRETKLILDYVESLNKVPAPVQYRSELSTFPESQLRVSDIVASVAIAAVVEKKDRVEDVPSESANSPEPQNSPVVAFLNKAGNILAEAHDTFCYELANVGGKGFVGYISSVLMGGAFVANLNVLSQSGYVAEGVRYLAGAGVLGYTAFNTFYHVIAGKFNELRGVSEEDRKKGEPKFGAKAATFMLLAIHLLSRGQDDNLNSNLVYSQPDNSNRIDAQSALANQGFFVEGTGDYAGMTFVYTPEEIRNVENLDGVVEAALDNVFSGYDHPEIQNENIRQMIADFGYDPVVLVKSLLLQESRALDVDNPPSYGPMQVNLAVAGRPSVSEFENFTLQQKIEAGLKVVVDSILYHKDHGQDVWLQQYNQIYYENRVPNYNRKPYANLIKGIYNNLLARRT